MPHIMIVEDDEGLSQGIVLSLRQNEYRFAQCYTLRDARKSLLQEQFDLILLDVGLPDGSGLDLCREIRQRSAVPILFLTANDAEYDEVAGLEAGGDDYITKPFSLAVLRARVTAALRRAQSKKDTVLCIDDMVFDFEQMSFSKGGRELTFSKTEQQLLRLLTTNRGQILSRSTLMDRIWDGGDFVDENTLTVAISRLRGKLEADPKVPLYIQTVYGLGYTWAVKKDE